ncbi:tRNA pseudouridine(55) synthase TruB [Candidatus Uhrbacteria bacterium]|nr:tRNA pseudouridine(55) synthase TruB [Candidatus Uhrbacteria bacterium]
MNTNLPTFGFLLIDKHAGWTSFDVVAKLRGITGVKKIGHAGTLDPFATGLLVVAVGKGDTTQIDQYVKKEKRYDSTFELGRTSTTQDPEGEITDNKITSFPSKDEIEHALSSFIGDIKQLPPMHSAIKIGGRKLYELARQGKEIDRPLRDVTVYELTLVSYEPPTLDVTMNVGSGTYVRAIARDLGELLKTGAYVTALRRTTIGNFDIKDAHKIEEVTSENWESLLLK